jgi:ectonucleotide pyrophosphatase/phosphodiesterase family protein 5
MATALATGAFAAMQGAAVAPATEPAPPLRVYVVVLDGLRPFEVTPLLMPNLNSLKESGTWYEQARSSFIAETLPNHSAMMTGVLPQRNGIVSNNFWQPNPAGTASFDVGNEGPKLLEADTLTTRLENSCQVSTATVQSKRYLWGLFRGETASPDDPNPQREADFHWDPRSDPGYVPSPSEHAVDQSTMNNGFLPWLRESPAYPQFAFVNLGDIDRAGHADETGASTLGGLSAFRQTAIHDTDVVIGQLIAELQQSGAWDETVLIFASDHGMDWGFQDKDMRAERTPQSAGYGTDSKGEPGRSPTATAGVGDYWGVGDGGAAMLHVEEEQDIAPIARLVAAQPGVEFVATKESISDLGNPTLAEMGLDHPRAGDIVAFAKPGWAERSTFASSNPLPGNHGHPVTQNTTLLVSGGHPVLRDTPASIPGPLVYNPGVWRFAPPAAGPGNLSIAPTVAALFGIGGPAGGYDGAPLSEAFEPYALASHPPCEAATPRPDLAISKADSPDPVRTREELTYTLDISNVGFAPATSVTVIDKLPLRTRVEEVSSTQGACHAGRERVTCVIDSLAAAESAMVTLQVRPYRRGSIENRASVSGAEAEYATSNNSDTEKTTVR